MDRNNSFGEVKWTRALSSELPKKDAGPKYSRISEHFRHVTPGVIQCSMFCGGNKCKYENPSRMKTEQMAINGLYSSWWVLKCAVNIVITLTLLVEKIVSIFSLNANLFQTKFQLSCNYFTCRQVNNNYLPVNKWNSVLTGPLDNTFKQTYEREVDKTACDPKIEKKSTTNQNRMKWDKNRVCERN